jgi:hypothetical protein
MSLNDVDFPETLSLERRDFNAIFVNVMIAIALLILTFLPEIIQDIILEVFVTSGFNILFVGFFLLTHIHILVAGIET